MFERIIIGIIIGLIAGFLLPSKIEVRSDAKNIALGFMALIVIAFIGSSLMFGAVYGVMAIGEIIFGYWLSSSILRKEKT